MYADIVRLKSGINIFDPDQEQTLMDEWKQDTAQLIAAMIFEEGTNEERVHPIF